MIQIIQVEGPVHADEVARRVTALWGLQRTGGRIVAAVTRGLTNALKRGAIVADGPFYSPGGAERPRIRDRSAVRSSTLRRPEMVPPVEIREAISQLVGLHIGVTREEVITQVSRLLGFKATSSQLREVIGREIDALVSAGQFSEGRNSSLALVTPTVH